MWCPKCNSEKTCVVGTDKSFVVQRYRRCRQCGYTFPTVEAHDYDPDWIKNAEHAADEARFVLKRQGKAYK